MGHQDDQLRRWPGSFVSGHKGQGDKDGLRGMDVWLTVSSIVP
jgi:hypothetical protein